MGWKNWNNVTDKARPSLNYQFRVMKGLKQKWDRGRAQWIAEEGVAMALNMAMG